MLAVRGRRTSPRHWTLRAAIAWSYGCSRSRREGCSSACRCSRACTLGEAEAVCGGVAGLLDELIAHSLLTTSRMGGRTIYAMLETCASTRPSGWRSAASATPCASAKALAQAAI